VTARTHQGRRNVARSLDPAELDETLASLLERLGDDRRRLALALGTDDGGLALLLGALDDEACPLGLCERGGSSRKR
jgi:hypothetical protein